MTGSKRAAVEKLLRRTALRGSDRPISFDQPVGGGGLGLDSLALVEFVVAFEKEFAVEVPETIWAHLEEITPGYFLEILEGRAPAAGEEGKGFLDKLTGSAARLFRPGRKS
jgi:acyl carrier protein